MQQKCVHLFFSALIVCLLCSFVTALHGHAQNNEATQDLPQRDQTYLGNLVSLSEVIGSAHAVRVRCNGVTDQYWRAYMVQILGLEAPDRSALRTSMVSGFNRGFERENRSGRSCDAKANADEAKYAARGRALSEQLASYYFPKRRN